MDKWYVIELPCGTLEIRQLSEPLITEILFTIGPFRSRGRAVVERNRLLKEREAPNGK